MEDILASIKRIIHDDPAPPRPLAGAMAPPIQAPPEPSRVVPNDPAPPWPRRTDPVAPDSILELTERVPDAFQARHHAPAPPPQAAPGPAPAPVQRAVERLRQAEAETPEPAPRPVPRDLLPRTPAPRAAGGDVTLDALVREMLQPMLADWIERNLPDMVERLVQTEIRRMTDKG